MEKRARKPDEAHIWTDAELEKLGNDFTTRHKNTADDMENIINNYTIQKSRR